MKVIGRTLRVGPVRFVVGKELESNECGSCHVGMQKLNINPEYGPDVQAITVLHESLHAILELHQYNHESANEHMIECLANGIVCLFRDNPWMKELIYGRE